MDGDMIHKISKQQVKGEERRREKEKVHRMQIDTPDQRDDQHDQDKEEQ